jgi:hypothetical protein
MVQNILLFSFLLHFFLIGMTLVSSFHTILFLGWHIYIFNKQISLCVRNGSKNLININLSINIYFNYL